MLTIPFGIYEGREIKKPERFDLINSEEDKKQALVVFASFVQRAGVKFIEVDGQTEDGQGWLLAGYGVGNSPPTIDKLTRIKDDCNSRVLVSVWWEPTKKSKYVSDGWRFTGAILAVIQKNNKYEPMLKEIPDVKIQRNSEFEEIPEKNERYEKILRKRLDTPSSSSSLSSLPLSKKTKPKKDKERVKKILENRSFLTRITDWVVGITEDELEKSISPSSSSHSSFGNFNESRSHREESSDDEEDGHRFQYQNNHSRSYKHRGSSFSSSDLRTLPSNFD